MLKTDSNQNICINNKIILCYGPQDKSNPNCKGWHYINGGFTTSISDAVRYARKVVMERGLSEE